ncbi:hypothetical protein BLL42_23665 [Pseudomonas frederiksbergensis]|uniref:Lipoprotein n=1 Tax=Pseudomonas frederiksbergensis TaxID=104087 RepID=A0A1J0EQY3_9PSED|nr:hypothetical protein [Pseudomonas frederiksbergensis]APC18562.1 hypothetical protein BLL42_23665 [Pseudomonas frederiksbergensis]
MRLNLFGSTFAALMASLAGACRWVSTSTAAGTWISPNVMPPYRHGKTGIAAARKSRNRLRHQHWRT